MAQSTNERVTEFEHNVTRNIFHSQLSASCVSSSSTYVPSSNGEISRTNESNPYSTHLFVLTTHFILSSFQVRYNRLYPLIIESMHYLMQHHWICAWLICSVIAMLIEALDVLLQKSDSSQRTAWRSNQAQQRSDTVSSLATKFLIFVTDSVHKELVQIARDCDIIHNDYEQWEYDTADSLAPADMECTPSICDNDHSDNDNDNDGAGKETTDFGQTSYALKENMSRKSVDNLSELMCDMDELNELISPNLPRVDFDFASDRRSEPEEYDAENATQVIDEPAFAAPHLDPQTAKEDPTRKRYRVARVLEYGEDDENGEDLVGVAYDDDYGYHDDDDDDDALYVRLFDEEYVFEPMYLCSEQLIKRMEGKIAERSSVYEMQMRGLLFGHPAVSRQLLQRKRDRRRSAIERMLRSHLCNRHKLGCWHLLDAENKVAVFLDYYAAELKVRNIPTDMYALLTMFYDTSTDKTYAFF